MAQAVETSASRTGKRYRAMFILLKLPRPSRPLWRAPRASASYAIVTGNSTVFRRIGGSLRPAGQMPMRREDRPEGALAG
jgi:hypothetical protein